MSRFKLNLRIWDWIKQNESVTMNATVGKDGYSQDYHAIIEHSLRMSDRISYRLDSKAKQQSHYYYNTIQDNSNLQQSLELTRQMHSLRIVGTQQHYNLLLNRMVAGGMGQEATDMVIQMASRCPGASDYFEGIDRTLIPSVPVEASVKLIKSLDSTKDYKALDKLLQCLEDSSECISASVLNALIESCLRRRLFSVATRLNSNASANQSSLQTITTTLKILVAQKHTRSAVEALIAYNSTDVQTDRLVRWLLDVCIFQNRFESAFKLVKSLQNPKLRQYLTKRLIFTIVDGSGKPKFINLVTLTGIYSLAPDLLFQTLLRDTCPEKPLWKTFIASHPKAIAGLSFDTQVLIVNRCIQLSLSELACDVCYLAMSTSQPFTQHMFVKLLLPVLHLLVDHREFQEAWALLDSAIGKLSLPVMTWKHLSDIPTAIVKNASDFEDALVKARRLFRVFGPNPDISDALLRLWRLSSINASTASKLFCETPEFNPSVGGWIALVDSSRFDNETHVSMMRLVWTYVERSQEDNAERHRRLLEILLRSMDCDILKASEHELTSISSARLFDLREAESILDWVVAAKQRTTSCI